MPSGNLHNTAKDEKAFAKTIGIIAKPDTGTAAPIPGLKTGNRATTAFSCTNA